MATADFTAAPRTIPSNYLPTACPTCGDRQISTACRFCGVSKLVKEVA